MGIYVVFFGGYQADSQAVTNWKNSAQQQRSDVTFDVYAYPSSHADGDKAVAAFDKQFDGVIKKFQASHADTLFIVGHSSGCALANELNSRIPGDHSHITLVDLDGYKVRHDQIKNSKVQAWRAQGPGGQGHSVRWDMGDPKFTYTALRATGAWPLHFSLVNKNADNTITGPRKDKRGNIIPGNYPTTGYAGCLANLEFLSQKP